MSDGGGEAQGDDSGRFDGSEWARQLAGATLVACAFGLVEWGLSWGEQAPAGARAMAAPIMLGAWAAMAWAWTTLAAVAVWPWFRHAQRLALRRAATQLLSRWWAERHGPVDRGRLATMISTMAAVALFVVASVAILAYLVEHRHGAVLIAVTGVALQVALALACIVLALVLRLVLLAVMARVGPVRALRFVNAPSLATAVCVAMVVALAAGGWVFREVMVATDVLSGLAPLLAVMLHIGLGDVFHRRMPDGRWVLSQPVFALALLVAGSSATQARALVLQHTDTSKYLLAAAIAAGDLDGDGATNFPFWSDCAPLDREVHPYAFEVDGNGRDENCDGEDAAAQLSREPWRAYRKPSGPQPNLVLVTFDAARADHFSFFGYRRPTAPGLAALAPSAVTFDNAFSQDSGTGPSLWSMMVGKTPFQTTLEEAHRFPPKLGAAERPLGQVLREGGYYAEGVLCGRVFAKKDWGIGRGFERFDNVCGKQTRKMAPAVTRGAIAALKRARKREPYFLWVHYYDPHAPYNSHRKPSFGDRPIDNYDEEIRYADRHLQRFRDALGKGGSGRPEFFFFSADHGENFGGHGKDPHARTLYREVTNVPLLVAGPGLTPRLVSRPVALGDLFPTLVELAQLQVPADSTMTSLVPVLYGEDPAPGRMVFQENSYSRPRRDAKAVIAGRYHYILDTSNDSSELYDHVADPQERRNLIGTGLEVEASLHDALLRFVSTTRVPEELSK